MVARARLQGSVARACSRRCKRASHERAGRVAGSVWTGAGHEEQSAHTANMLAPSAISPHTANAQPGIGFASA